MKLLLANVALFALFNVNGAFGSRECGKVLLNRGKSNEKPGNTLEGQWPWQVTIYQQPLGKNPKYICGGTLVSKRHVITAAHCAVARTGAKINLKVYLAKHNLKDTGEKAVEINTVKKIVPHPEYNKTSFYRDLAILELQDPVTFSEWVQPACLWPDTEIELKKIVGQTGSVVGWGIDDTGVGTEEQSLLQMPVVSQETCIRSYPEFFARFTSDSTYCAGSRDACTRVSGDGMVFEKDGSWYLRGVVSLMVAIQNETRCNPTHYTIFADVAQALPWIKMNMRGNFFLFLSK